MSQTQSDPTQTPPPRPAATTTSPTTSQPGGGDDDPLSHLHKMSTTAGLGSGEYVAVNGAAVVTLLLGLASALTLFEELLLVIPITAIIVGIVAWRQVNQSNGTQTGKGLVVVGLLCAIGFGGFVVTREATRGMRTRDDRNAIRATINEFGAKVKAGDVDGAYTMFTGDFKQQIDPTLFKQRVELVRQSEIFGSLKDTSWNGLASFQTEDATGRRYAVTKFKMNLDKTQVDMETTLRKDDGRWVFHSMPTLFPPPQQQQQPGRQ